MYNILAGLKEYFRRQEIVTDNVIFRLHYIFTTVLLIAFSLLVTATQYVGNPIQCINDNDIPIHVINTYCWISTTFTIPTSFMRAVGSEVPHPGLGAGLYESKDQKHYAYYQWVCFILFFQAILCYVPRWLWSAWEGGLMQTIVLGLNSGLKTVEERTVKKRILIDYLLVHFKQHNMYAIRYWFCEVLCLVNIIGQLYLMNRFTGGEFFSYGLKVLSFANADQEERFDPMVYVFPRVTKCTFHKFGSSGTISRHDSMCVLSQNIINEKTYIFLWFWFIIMATLLALLIVYRAILLAVPRIRPLILHARNRFVPSEVINAISDKLEVGDWWILYMLGRNLEPLVYREVVSELSKKIETNESNNA
uniref:Innexin n=1 Tax=Daphnia galeata TaxID=27404 RepID=A0A8J2RGK1_9CRUS|nr:unnamed protein product [Daphnia galeata]